MSVSPELEDTVNVIARAVEAILSEPCSGDIEEMCHISVANVIKQSRRLLSADEVEDIVEDVVDGETLVDPEDMLDGDELRMSDIEWDSVEPERKVDADGVEGCVIGGRFYPVSTFPDQRAGMYASRIAAVIQSVANTANLTEGVNIRSLYHPVPIANIGCPRCASTDVTPVWYDDGRVTACCNKCLAEFDADIEDVAQATLVDKTIEDVDILPEHDIFGSVWYSGDGRYGFEVYSSGELVDSGEAGSLHDIQERFDDIADAFDDIEDGVEVDFTNGNSAVVDAVDGDDVVLVDDGREASASRIRLARMVVDKKAYIDGSGRLSMDFRPGDVVVSKNGSRIRVDEVAGGKVFSTVTMPKEDGGISQFRLSSTPREFHDILNG